MKKIILLTSLILLTSFSSAMAATVTWDGSASSNWSNAANWDTNSVPASGDDVVIANAGSAPTLNIAGQSIGDLTIAAGTTLTLSENITVSGNLDCNGSLVFNSIQNMRVSGDVDFTGATTFTAASGTFIFEGVNQDVTSAGKSFYSISVQNATVTLQDTLTQASGGVLSLTASSTLVLSGQTLVLGAGVDITGGTLTIGSGVLDGSTNSVSFSVGTGGTVSLTSGSLSCLDLTISGAGTFGAGSSTITTTGDVNITSTGFAKGTSTLEMGGGATARTLVSSESLNNLTVLNTGGVSLGSYDLILSGNLSIVGSAKLDLNTRDLTQTGAGPVDIDGTLTASGAEMITVGGNVDFTNGTFAASSSTFIFNGTGNLMSDGQAFYHVTINAGKSVTIQDSLEVDGTLTTGGTLDMNNLPLTMASNLNLANQNISNILDVIFDATSGTQTISTNGTSLADVTFDDASGGATFQLLDTLTQTGTTLITAGTVDLNGNTLVLGDDLTVATGVLSVGTGVLDGVTNSHNISVTAGSVTISSGTLSGVDLTVSGTGVLNNTGVSNLNLSGDVSITSANWTAGNSILTMSGVANLSSNQALNDLVTSGTVTLLTSIDVNGDLGITGTLNQSTFVTNLSGDLTITAGTFTKSSANPGLVLDGSLTLADDGANDLGNVQVSAGQTVLMATAISMTTLDLDGTLDDQKKDLTIAGALLNDGLLKIGGSENVTIGTMDDTSGTVEFLGDTGNVGGNTPSTFYHVIFNAGSAGAGTLTVLSNLAIHGDFTLTSGVLDQNDLDITVTGSVSLAAAGTATFIKNSVSTNFFILDGNGVTLSSSSQDLGPVKVLTGGVVTLGTDCVMTILDLDSGSILDTEGFDLTVSGQLFNDGTLKVQGSETVSFGTMDTDSGLVEYDGSGGGTITSPTSYNDLSVSDGTFSLGNDITVNGALNLSGSDELILGAKTLTLLSDLDLSDNINVGAGTLNAAGQNITVLAAGTIQQTTGTVNGADLTIDGDYVCTGASTINVSGDLSIGASSGWSEGLSTINMTGVGKSIGADRDVYNVNTSGTVTLSNSLVVNGNLSVDSNSLTQNATLTLNGDFSILDTASFFKGNPVSDSVIFASDSTLAGNTQDLGEVFVNAGVTVTLGASSSAKVTNLNIVATGTFDCEGSDLTITSALINDGTLILQGTEDVSIITMDVDSGVVRFDGSGVIGTTNPSTYFELEIVNGNFDLAASITLAGDLDIQSGQLGLETFTLTMGTDLDLVAGTLAIENGVLNGSTNSKDVTVNGGTLDHGDGTMNIVDLTVSTGTYASTGNAPINLTGDLSIANTATWISGNSLITMSGTTKTIDVESSHALNDLVITGTGIGLNTNDLDIDGDFTLTSGSFDHNSLNMNVAGNFTLSVGATYTQGATNLTFDGATTIITDTQSLEQVIVGANSAATLGADLTISAMLTIHSGATFDVESYNLDLSAGALVNSGTLTIQGTETVDIGTMDTSSGNVRFDGGGNYTLGNNLPSSYYAIEFVSGNFTLVQNITLANNFTVSAGNSVVLNTYTLGFGADLDLSAGQVDVGSGTLTGGNSASLTVRNAGVLTLGNSGSVESLNLSIINSGTATVSGSGDLKVWGNAEISSANWTPSNSELILSGTSKTLNVNQVLNDLNVTGTYTLVSDLDQPTGVLSLSGTLSLSTFTLTLSSDLVLGAGTLAVGSGNLNASSYDITVNGGALTLGSGVVNSVDLTISGAGASLATTGSLYAAGDVSITGTWAAGTSTLLMTGSAKTLTASTALSNLSVAGGTVTLGGNVDVNADFNVSSGSLTLNSQTLCVGGDFTLAAGTTFNGSPGILKLDGSSSALTLAGQTIDNVQVASGALVTLQSNVAISGLDLDGTLDSDGNDLSLAGTFSNDGVLVTIGSENLSVVNMDTDSGTVRYDGNFGVYEIGSGNIDSFYHLETRNGSFKQSSSLDMSSFSLISGSFDQNNQAISMTKNWITRSTNDSIGMGTVTFSGSGNSTISGNTTFYNLASSTAGKELYFEGNTTQVVTNALTMTGAVGNSILMKGTPDGATFTIDNPSDSSSLEYVHIVNAFFTNRIFAPNSTQDGSSNVNIITDFVNLTAPVGGESWTGVQTITWTTSGAWTSGSTADILISQNNFSNSVILASLDVLSGIYTFDTTAVNDGDYAVKFSVSGISISTATGNFTVDNQPEVLSAALDYETGVLQITFSEAIDIAPVSNVDLSKVHLNNVTALNSSGQNLDGATVNSSSGAVVSLTLTESQRLAALKISGLTGGNGSIIVLDVDAGAFINVAGVANRQTGSVSMVETADSTAPILNSWSLDMRSTPNTITFNFNEAVVPNTVDLAQVILHRSATGGTGPLALSAGTTSSVVGTSVVVSLSLGDVTNINSLEDGFVTSSRIYLSASAGLIADVSGASMGLISSASPLKATLFERSLTNTEDVSILLDGLDSGLTEAEGGTVIDAVIEDKGVEILVKNLHLLADTVPTGSGDDKTFVSAMLSGFQVLVVSITSKEQEVFSTSGDLSFSLTGIPAGHTAVIASIPGSKIAEFPQDGVGEMISITLVKDNSDGTAVTTGFSIELKFVNQYKLDQGLDQRLLVQGSDGSFSDSNFEPRASSNERSLIFDLTHLSEFVLTEDTFVSPFASGSGGGGCMISVKP